jgi:hypothetical protein
MVACGDSGVSLIDSQGDSEVARAFAAIAETLARGLPPAAGDHASPADRPAP